MALARDGAATKWACLLSIILLSWHWPRALVIVVIVALAYTNTWHELWLPAERNGKQGRTRERKRQGKWESKRGSERARAQISLSTGWELPICCFIVCFEDISNIFGQASRLKLNALEVLPIGYATKLIKLDSNCQIESYFCAQILKGL